MPRGTFAPMGSQRYDSAPPHSLGRSLGPQDSGDLQALVTVMASGRAIVIGAAWTYGAQLATIAAQFVYAGVTSRSVDAAGFGAYSIALSISSIFGLIANGGLGQTVGRMEALERKSLQSLLTLAVLLGLGASILLAVTADFWAEIWGAPDAAMAIRWCGVGAFVAPTVGLSGGLLRRQGRFRSLAIATLATNLLGFLLGTIAVVTLHSAESLLVSPLVAQVALVISTLVLNRRHLRGLSSLRAARPYITFSWQVTVQNIGSWLTGNVGTWTMSRVFSPSILGQWNRADVLTSVPFQQVQTAMVQAVYPEFRHDINGPSRARRVWPDLLGLVAWIAMPLSGAAAVVAPVLIPILFGDGWRLAATFSSALAVIAGVRMVRVLLGAAIEALGRYVWVWTGIGVEFLLTVSGVLASVLTNDYRLILLGVGVGVAGAHVASVVVCWRAGYLDMRVLLRHYGGALAGGFASAGLVLLVLLTIERAAEMPWLLAVAAVVLVALVAAGRHWAENLPPVKLARQYGLLSDRRADE